MIMQAPLVMLVIQRLVPRSAGPGTGAPGRLRAAKRGGEEDHEVRYASTSPSWAAGQPVLPVTSSFR
ncbi:hypothetical protein SANTM175S_05185 [Streptomyces antimycoticus]